MSDVEYVSTSDPGEIEETTMLWVKPSSRNIDSQSVLLSNERAAAASPPRKRQKVSHDSPFEKEGNIPLVLPAKVLEASTSPIVVSSETGAGSSAPVSIGYLKDEGHRILLQRSAAELPSSSSLELAKLGSPTPSERVVSLSPPSHPTSPHVYETNSTPAPSSNRGISVDPLLLFTPSPSSSESLDKHLTPDRRTPPDSPSFHRNPSSSPLTPVHSPTTHFNSPQSGGNFHHTDEPLFRASSFTSDGEPQPGSGRLPDRELNVSTEYLQDMETRRYSLRTRNQRQLMPYKYDETMYTRQLRNMPEAIVKMPNIQHRHHREGSHSRNNAPSSDGEVNPDTLEAGSSDGEGRARGRSTSGPQTGPHSSPERRSFHVHGQQSNTWLPAALRVDFSSDSDHELESLIPSRKGTSPSRPLSKTKRRKHIKRFPMSVKKYGKQSAAQNHTDDDDVPVKKSRPMLLTGGPAESSEDETRETSETNRRTVSLCTDIWPVDDPGGLLDSSERHTSVPPTSSSIGRLSDVDDYHREASLSPIPLQPGELDGLESRRPSPVEVTHEHFPLYDVQDNNGQSSNDDPQYSSDEMDARARRYWKAGKHMMPKVMLMKAFADSNKHMQRRKSKQPEQIPVAGLVRRKARGSHGAPIEIKGDSESSESEQGAGKNYEQRTLDLYVGRIRATSLLSSSNSSESEASIHEEVEDDEVSRWNQHPEEWRRSTKDRLKEGSLVDYMLGGTRIRGHPSKRHTGSGQPKRSSRGPRLAQGAISVTISGPRRHSSFHQSHISDHLPPPKSQHNSRNQHNGAPKERSKSFRAGASATEHHTEQHEIPDAATIQRHKERKRKKANPGLYTFDGGGRLTSGRRQTNAVSIDAEDELCATPSRNFIPHFTRKSSFRKRTVSSSVMGVIENTTLDSYFADHSPPPEDPIQPLDPPPVPHRPIRHRLHVDAGIRPLPLGITFSRDTYLGKGRLRELLDTRSGVCPDHPPPPFYIDGFTMSHTISVFDFANKVSENVENIISQLSEPGLEITEEYYKSRSRFLYSICVHATWITSHASEEERSLLVESAGRVLTEAAKLDLSSTTARHDGSLHHRLALEIGWTVIELALRIRVDSASKDDATRLVDHILTLMEHLWLCGLASTFDSVAQAPSVLDYTHIDVRLAELWVCLIHVCGTWSVTNTVLSFWECLERIMRRCVNFDSQDDNFSVSELVWQTIYIVAALSQFSTFGNTSTPSPSATSWACVMSALNLVPYAAHPPSQRRDRYISLLVNRCVHLHTNWRWNLEDAPHIFQYLCRAFQARRYQNLLHEKHCEFPDFLLHLDLHLLYTPDPGDTTFVTFLKLIMQSADPASRRVEALTDPPPSPSIRKLLAMLVPVSSVKFDKGTPATDKESSMLINRFSAVAVGLVLVPTSFKNYLSQARRYVDFKQMDLKTRRVCIRGLMYLTCILRHLDLPLDEALDWLTDMTDVLVDEFCQPNPEASTERRAPGLKDRIAVCIQMLLGTIRCIVDNPSMNKKQPLPKYPDPSLLGGAWVVKVFASSTKLLALPATRRELVLLTLAFLDARSAIIPNPPRPRVIQQSTEEESQELYAEMDSFNYDDPELTAALGEHERESTDTTRLEADTCTVLKRDVWPAVNSCVYADIKRLRDPSKDLFDTYWEQATTSINCWVRCASIIVKNDSKERPWSWFLSIGIPSQDLKQPVRSKIELSYKLAILRCDPSSFNDYADNFIEHFLQALSTYQITLEHEYASLVIILGSSKHPLLAGLLQQCTVDDGNIRLTKTDLLNTREDMINRILSNLDESFRKESGTDYGLQDQNQVHLHFVAIMFTVMKETLDGLGPSEREEYAIFCSAVSTKLFQSLNLRDRCRDERSLSWALSIAS
ncbi:Mus7/MMS22 family-domain-containing protein [Irpex rosettiformis]|uniref:Mus7/MMS22 family-domain-containing protein n=1 Tax=Irpex rosettiformis TaxID=378272 RepID=A0ACB8U1H9_9APHY|nr:Mus7/MMS22 family-domain-containing protein [Irpex rosettiformis]